MGRCQNCHKKSHIVQTCKCLRVLCIQCRFPDDHGCKYDDKSDWTEKLKKENPVVVPEKVIKI